MKKKAFIFLLLAAFLCTASGCGIPSFGSADTLMHPPKASGNKEEIQNVIEEQAGTDYVLNYPQSGENRSSIIMKDIDGDDTEEAIALLTLNPNTDNAESHIYIIDEKDDKWIIKGDFKNANNSIDRIDFGDLNGNGMTDILVGWNTYNVNQHNLYCYLYGDKIQEINTKITYTSMAVGQFTGESKSTIITASLSTLDSPAKGRLLSISNKNVVTAYEVPMDNNITMITSLKAGMIDSKTSGVFVDGLTSSNTYNTQVLYFRKNKLVNPVNSKAQKGILSTDRNLSTVCTDFDNDGITEIPVTKKLPFTSSKDEANTAFETVWSSYNSGNGIVSPKITVVINENYKYHIVVPDEWIGNYTALYNGDSSVLTFKQATENGNSYLIGETIVEYMTTLTKDWTNIGSKKGFTKMQDLGIYAYGYKIGAKTPFILSKDEAYESFVPKEETESMAVSPVESVN